MESAIIVAALLLFVGVVIHLGMDEPVSKGEETMDDWNDRQW